MKPEDIDYMTLLDEEYSKDLKEVKDGESLRNHIEKYEYWLDSQVKDLGAKDWDRLKPLIDDCRTEGVTPGPKHMIAIELMMPARIFRVSILAVQAGVPWGCAYIRMKEEKLIKY